MRHIRYRAALIGASLAAVAVLASACGSSTTTTNPPASDPSTSPTASPTSPAPAPKPTSTLPQTGDLAPTIPIESVKLSADGKKLTVSYYIGPAACHGTLDRADVEQNATGVSVRLLRKAPAKTEGIACVDIVELKTTDVTLDTPLGSRPITDAGTEKPIKVTS